jgi:hypothetical protein
MWLTRGARINLVMEASACTLMQVSRRRLKDMRQTWLFALMMVAYALARLCIGAPRLPAARRKTVLRRFASAADPQPRMPVLAAQARGLGEIAIEADPDASLAQTRGRLRTICAFNGAPHR